MLLSSKIKSLGFLTIKPERKSFLDEVLFVLFSKKPAKKITQFLKV
jgi:hypothetical protein